MKLMIDSFWRAWVYCLHPRVFLLSFAPLILLLALVLSLGHFYWAWAQGWAAWALEKAGQWLPLDFILKYMGMDELTAVAASVLVIFVVTPLLVMVSLAVVSALMSPALVKLVAGKRFVNLQRRRGASWVTQLAWSLGSLLMATLAMALSIPLWLIPPLVIFLPPLIWGWLTFRVLAFDALAEHADVHERRVLLTQHRIPLLIMGVTCGYLGGVPSLLWSSGAMAVSAFVLLVPIAIWAYTLVFAFSSLWFIHYCLAALSDHRQSPNSPPGHESNELPLARDPQS